MITILDYGVGNLGSIVNMFRKIGVTAAVASSSEEVDAATKILLPGVGAFDHAMGALTASDMLEALVRRVRDDRVPLLGICLGMQMLGKSSDEGAAAGLGFINATSEKIKSDPARRIKVPHMGWNEITIKKESPLIEGFRDHPRFYFVHSYHMVCEEPGDILATVEYGQPMTCMIQRENVYGAQFHPEKSHRFGMTILRNFAEL